jgi:hypothetical protein
VAESKDIFVPYSVPNPGADRFDDRVAQISGCAPAKAGSHKDFRISGISTRKLTQLYPERGNNGLSLLTLVPTKSITKADPQGFCRDKGGPVTHGSRFAGQTVPLFIRVGKFGIHNTC